MNYNQFGFEAFGPEEAVYLFSLWSVVKAMEKLDFYEFDINSSFCQSVFWSIFPFTLQLKQGVEQPNEDN